MAHFLPLLNRLTPLITLLHWQQGTGRGMQAVCQARGQADMYTHPDIITKSLCLQEMEKELSSESRYIGINLPFHLRSDCFSTHFPFPQCSIRQKLHLPPCSNTARRVFLDPWPKGVYHCRPNTGINPIDGRFITGCKQKLWSYFMTSITKSFWFVFLIHSHRCCSLIAWCHSQHMLFQCLSACWTVKGFIPNVIVLLTGTTVLTSITILKP